MTKIERKENNNKEKRDLMRQQIGQVVDQIKDGSKPTIKDLCLSFGVSEKHGQLIISSARAWILREDVASITEQLLTRLDGIKPIATINSKDKLA